MNILRVAGVVVGIHVFALILIFANPGCSSTSKPAPASADTISKSEPSPSVTVPLSSNGSGSGASDHSPLTPAPLTSDSSSAITFNAGSNSVRYSPTRPGNPATTALEAQPVADVTPASTYTIVSGDSLSLIAKKNKLTIAELAVANNLKRDAILRQGQKLIIPSKAVSASTALPPATRDNAAAPAAAVAKPAADALKHTVKSGETLGAIAKKYGVKAGDIAVANNITDPQKIRPGKELIIPHGQASASKAAAKSTKPAVSPATPPSPEPVFDSPSAIRMPSQSEPYVAPPPGQDLDAGLKSAPTNDVPVIKVENAPDSSSRKP